jgi:hypothetical protein
MSEYVDIESVGTEAEELGNVVSPEFSDRPLTPPGKYVSELRKITAKPQKDESGKVTGYTFQIDFQGGLVDRTSGRKFFRPDRTWVSTKTFRKRDFSQGSKDNPVFFPGETSTVADYLNACGYSRGQVKDLKGSALISVVAESQYKTVGVKTGLRDRGKKQGDGSYSRSRFYTKAFLDPASNGEAKYLRSIEKDGETFEAQEQVEGFVRLTA